MTDDETAKKPASLDEAKEIVEQEFLGTCGIHGVGKKVSKNAVRVYATEASTTLEDALRKIRSRCRPFEIDVVIEERPIATMRPEESTAIQADPRERERRAD